MDLILSQFNLDSPFPTFFEMRAQEELMPILKAAFRYGLTVTAQRVPRLIRVLGWVDEVFLLLWLFIDGRFLLASDATFGENFYAMKRVIREAPKRSPSIADASENSEQQSDATPTDGAEGLGTFGGAQEPQDQLGRFLPLRPRDRVYSVLVAVLIPYIRTKLAALLTRLREETPQQEQDRLNWEQQQPRWLANLARASRVGFMKTYPWVNGAYEITTFWYWLNYLFEWPWWSPFNHRRRIVLKRMDMQDYMAQSQGPHARFTEGTKVFLMVVVMLFKVLEWWHSTESVRQDGEESEEQRPPAPPAPRTITDLTGVLETQCPVCKQNTTNPTLNASSGVVYCYPCIHQYVEANRSDPVTHTPCTLDHLRRIYESAQ